MGFYGNITNTSRTQFQFDKVYSNRYEMELAMGTDGIYMGRYVLVDYDQQNMDNYRQFYVDNPTSDNAKFYMWAVNEKKTEVEYSRNVKQGEIIRATSDYNLDGSIKNNAVFYFYKCTNTGDPSIPTIATFTRVSGTQNVYTTNYEIDMNEYGAGRGYDSTVWQKVYTQGIAKYVMIAELNSVVPTFEVVEDAPTMVPLPPHFDQASNNVHYKMHYQPQWGLRVRSAEAKDSTNKNTVPSDENVIWKRHSYDVQTDKETVIESTEKGAIYYNKAGFYPETISYDGRENKISIEPTGYSGYEYNVHNSKNPAEKARANDIQEISVILPSIGNSISQMWDIVYGGEDISDDDGNRNMDIAWDSYEGHRLVEEDAQGNGFTYSTDKVETLAGAINSIHDLMGMIIIDVDDEQQIIDGDLNKIYYLHDTDEESKNNKYYRKKLDYEYTDIEITDENYFDLKEVDLVEDNYHPNHFYIASNGEFIPDEGPSFDPTKEYRELILKTNGSNETVKNLYQYSAGEFFYKENYGKTYVLDQNPVYNNNKVYYKVTGLSKSINLDNGYKPNTYYYKDNKNYLLETAENSTTTREYFLPVFETVIGFPYIPGKYFYRDEKKVIKIDNEPTMDSKREYFTATIEKTETTVIQKPDGSYEYVDAFIVKNEEKVTLFEISNKDMVYYYKNNNNYYVTSSVINNNSTYYILKSEEKISNFYMKDKFYVTNDNITFILDEREEFDKEEKYYEITEAIKVNMFYEPGKFVDGNDSIVNEEIKPDIDLYYKDEFYISNNSKNNENKYALWNNNITSIPNTITLAKRNQYPIYKKEELQGFARDLNTIHGLILEVNKILELADEKTREKNNINGLINKINDIIYKIDALKPGHIMIVDDYGKMHSSDFDTLQNITCENQKSDTRPGGLLKDVAGDLYDKATTVADMRKQWITMNVNSDIKNPKITIHHNFQAVENTNSSWDKNSKTGSGTHSEIEIDNIQLYTPIVDDMGHVVGKNLETVTLPYGFKTIKTNGHSSAKTNMNAETVDIIANNTQDILSINSHNKWIKIANSNNSHSVTIAHEVNPIDITSKGTTNSNKEDGAADENNINIPDWFYDEAGHITEKHDHYYTLPYGFKTITTNGRSDNVAENAIGTPSTPDVVAENTQDTLAINSGNKWIRIDTNTDEDTLTISHDVHKTSSTSKTTDWTTTEANTTIPVPTYSYDEAGHYKSHHTESYKLPFAYGKIKGDSGDTAATATYDELTFGSDDWLTATVTENTVTYSHDYPKEVKDDTESSLNINDKVDDKIVDKIILETLRHDEKGHIINVDRNTVTLPFGYKVFEDSNQGSSVAQNTQDTFKFSGDSWIKSSVSQGKLEITHVGPVGTIPDAKPALTPNFGETFSVDDWYFDDKGHKYAGGTHTIKIPQPSLNDLTSSEASVITKLELNATTGALTQTNKNVGDLILTGYTAPLTGGKFDSTNTINVALRQLQDQIISEENTRSTAIVNLTTNLNDEVTNRNNAIKAVTGNSTETIENLATQLAQLQEAYNLLLTRIEALEEYHKLPDENV